MTVTLERRNLISESVDYKELAEELEGVRWIGNKCSCPWGSDTTPSMYYLPDKHFIYCFHCSEGYDAVWFTAKSKRCSLEEAARWLERKYHFSNNYDDDTEEPFEKNMFERVADYYTKCVGSEQDMNLDQRLKVRAWFWKMSKYQKINRLLKSINMEIEDFEEEGKEDAE
jgi:DNA primase